MSRYLLILVALAGCHAQGRMFWLSQAAAIGANVMDARSSYGFQELNPLMRSRDGRFGARAVGLKVSLSAVSAVGQYLILRRHRTLERRYAIVNFAAAGMWTASALRNYRLRAQGLAVK